VKFDTDAIYVEKYSLLLTQPFNKYYNNEFNEHFFDDWTVFNDWVNKTEEEQEVGSS